MVTVYNVTLPPLLLQDEFSLLAMAKLPPEPLGGGLEALGVGLEVLGVGEEAVGVGVEVLGGGFEAPEVGLGVRDGLSVGAPVLCES